MQNRIETIVIKHELTKEEKNEYNKKIVSLIINDLDDLKNRKKDAMKEFNAEIKQIESEATRLADIISSGVEDRLIECEWKYNQLTNKMNCIRIDTKEFIKERDLTNEEKQLDFTNLLNRTENGL